MLILNMNLFYSVVIFHDYKFNQIIMSYEVSERYTRFNNVYVMFPRKEVFKNYFMYRASRL